MPLYPYPPEEVSAALRIMAIAAEGLSGPQRQLRGRRVAHELEAFRNMVRTNAQLEMIKDAEAEVDKRRKAR